MVMDYSFCFLLSEFWKTSNLGIRWLIYTNRAIKVILIMVIIMIIIIIIIIIIMMMKLIIIIIIIKV